MKKKYLAIAATVVIVPLILYFGVKRIKDYKTQKIYDQDYKIVEEEKISVKQITENLQAESDAISKIKESHPDLTIDQAVLYNDQELYIYRDVKKIDHLIYGNEELYQCTSDESICFAVFDQDAYVRIINFVKGTTILYQLNNGKLEDIWEDSSNSDHTDDDYITFVDNNENLVFAAHGKIYYEKDGSINSFTPESGELTYGEEREMLVIGDYIVYSVNKNTNTKTHVYNMITQKDTEVKFVCYNGDNIDFDIYSINYVDLDHNMFLMIINNDQYEETPYYKGIIDEENKIILYYSC